MGTIRQKNDLTDEVQLVCHGASKGLESRCEQSRVVESVSGITRAAIDCRGSRAGAAVCRLQVSGIAS
jgi:hypothetical protein